MHKLPPISNIPLADSPRSDDSFDPEKGRLIDVPDLQSAEYHSDTHDPEMRSDGVSQASQERVARNAGTYFLAQVLSWAVTFVTVSIIPRALGEQMLGDIVVAGSTVNLVFGIGAFNIEMHIIREVGRDHREAERLLRGLYGMRLALIPLLGLVSLIVMRCIHAGSTVQFYACLSMVTTIFGFFIEPLRSTLVGWEQARRVSASDLLFSFAPLLMIPLLRYRALAYYGVTIFAFIVVFVVRFRWVRSRARLRPTFDPALWMELIRGGLPFLITNLVASLYVYAGIMILRHYTDDAAVGQYSQAGKLIGTFLFIPTVLGTALLPSLTRMAQGDPAVFRRTQLRVLSVLIVAGLPVTVGVILLATPLCHLLYGPDKFTALPLALKYSALTILPLYIVSTIYQFLVALNRNAVWTYVMMGTLVLYTLTAWTLIPMTLRLLHNGIVGAVLGTLVAESAATVIAFVLLKTNPLTREVLGWMGRSLLATVGMAAVILMMQRLPLDAIAGPVWIGRLMALLAPSAAGALVFVCMAWLLRALPPEEQALIMNMVRRKFSGQ